MGGRDIRRTKTGRIKQIEEKGIKRRQIKEKKKEKKERKMEE
jgi:hypothetical protein